MLLGMLLLSGSLHAQQSKEPLVKVGGQAITLEMVDAIIDQRFSRDENTDLKAIAAARAAVLTKLIERQQALHCLLAMQGGRDLQREIQQAQATALAEVQRVDRRGQLTDAQKLTLAWEHAWERYLHQSLTVSQLQRFFLDHPYRYDGTKVLVGQIFLPHREPASSAVGESYDPAEELERIRQQIDRRELTFEQAARQHSRGSSAADGGTIGWIEKAGDLPRDLRDVALAGEPGQVLGPIRTSLGWHLIRVQEKRKGARSFEALEDLTELRRDAAEMLFNQLVERGSQQTAIEWIDPVWESILRASPPLRSAAPSSQSGSEKSGSEKSGSEKSGQ